MRNVEVGRGVVACGAGRRRPGQGDWGALREQRRLVGPLVAGVGGMLRRSSARGWRSEFHSRRDPRKATLVDQPRDNAVTSREQSRGGANVGLPAGWLGLTFLCHRTAPLFIELVLAGSDAEHVLDVHANTDTVTAAAIVPLPARDRSMSLLLRRAVKTGRRGRTRSVPRLLRYGSGGARGAVWVPVRRGVVVAASAQQWPASGPAA